MLFMVRFKFRVVYMISTMVNINVTFEVMVWGSALVFGYLE